MENTKKRQLIEILFDNSARIDEKDDAADYLAKYPDDDVIRALIQVGTNTKEDDMVLETCGESLARIWIKKENFDLKSYNKLLSTTRFGVYCVVRDARPDWVNKFELYLDKFTD